MPSLKTTISIDVEVEYKISPGSPETFYEPKTYTEVDIESIICISTGQPIDFRKLPKSELKALETECVEHDPEA